MESEDLEIAKSMPANYAIAYTRFIEKFNTILRHQGESRMKQIDIEKQMGAFKEALHIEKEERVAGINAVKEECGEESKDIIKAAAGWSLGALFLVACSIVGFLAYKL